MEKEFGFSPERKQIRDSRQTIKDVRRPLS
jgi:hypothetical protein